MSFFAHFVRKQSGIVTPSIYNELETRGLLGQLISLRGTMYGIMTDKITWHVMMINSLRAAGYEGNIYVPLRLDEDIDDSDDIKQQTKENNRRAYEASVVQVFYQPDYEELPSVGTLLPFVLEAERRERLGLASYIIGADRPDVLGLSGDMHFKVHAGYHQTAQAAYKSLFPLVAR